MSASQRFAEVLYRSSQQQQTAASGDASGSDDVVDAEVVEGDEEESA
jgi:hypothetical protein